MKAQMSVGWIATWTFAVAALVFGVTPAASAYTQYTYAGNNYTDAEAPFTTEMSLTISLSLLIDLGANQIDVDLLPHIASIRIFDGVFEYREWNLSSFNSFRHFRVSTDESGDIVEWWIGLGKSRDSTDREIDSCSDRGHELTDAFVCSRRGTAVDFAFAGSGGLTASSARVTSAEGTWVGVVPEPSTASLAGLGFLALGAMRRSRRSRLRWH